MSVKSAQAIVAEFVTSHPQTGAAVDADATPTAVLTVDGTDNGASVTVSDVGTGRYKAAVTLPALTAGQVVALVVSATVAGIAGSGVIWQEVADTARVSDVSAKTDNLPSDPADQSAVEAAITAATSPLATAAALATVDGNVDAVLEDTGTTLPSTLAALDVLIDAVQAAVDDALKVLKNKTITDPATGVMTVYADDGVTPLYEADLFEDAAGLIPFDGSGANRRERLT